MEVKDIYKKHVPNFYYDEEYNFNGTFIEDYYHGVCIDFSLYLLDELEKNNLKGYLISTKTETGANHGAVLYKKNNILYVADPIYDARYMTENNMNKESRKNYINNSIKCDIPLKTYIEENGLITIYGKEFEIILEEIDYNTILKMWK